MTTLNILPIIRKEFRQIRRDRRTLGVLLFIPSFMLMMFGYAVNFDVKHTSMAILDNDETAVSRELIRTMSTTEYFDVVAYLTSVREADASLDRGDARVVVVIPEGFSESIERSERADIQILIDGANASAAATSIGYIRAMVQDFSLGVIQARLIQSGTQELTPPIDLRARIWYNPELRSAKFLVPGLIAFILMVTAVISTALSVAREPELGTMEQIIVSPVRPVELILGKTIPYTLISAVATVVIVLIGNVVFEVEVRGSYLLLSLVSLLFLVGGLGLGLLISTIAESQQLAFMIAVIVTMLPTFLLSGFVFPIRNMPAPIQAVTYLVPARYFLVAIRAIILKGAGLGAFWDQVLFLLVYAMGTLTISSVRLRRMLRRGME